MLQDTNKFQELFLLAFGDVDQAQEVECETLKICQGNCPAATLVSEFQRLTLKTKWLDSILFNLFYQAHNNTLKDEIWESDCPNSMDEYYKLTIFINNSCSKETKRNVEIVTYKTKTFILELKGLTILMWWW